MGSLLRLSRSKRYLGQTYDQVITVNAPVVYCLKDGKVRFINIEVFEPLLTFHERDLLYDIMDCMLPSIVVPKAVQESFPDNL